MSDARKFTEKEIEAIFLEQWETAIGEGRQGALNGFQRLKGWVGPQYWKLLASMEFTEWEWKCLINIIPDGMYRKMSSRDFLAEVIGKGADRIARTDAEKRLEENTRTAKPKPTVERTIATNVVLVQFGKRNETTDRANL